MQTEPRPTLAFSRRIENLQGSVARHILSRSQDADLISFAGGLPSPEMWQDLDLPRLPKSAFQYGPSEGDKSMRDLFAERLQGLGIACSPKRLIVTTGSQQGLDLLSKLFIDPGSPVGIESPTYLAALQNFQLFGAKLVALPTGSPLLSLEQWSELLQTERPRFVYLNPTYQNPSGACYSLEERRAVASLFDEYDTVLIEDDPYRDLHFEDAPPPPICSFLSRAPWAYLSSVSKILLPGLRIGCLAASEALYPHLLKLKQAADLHSSRTSQAIACHLLRDASSLRQRLARALASYRAKRDLMLSCLENDFHERARWLRPSGGMFVWLELAKQRDLFADLENCLSEGVAFMPGDPFFADSQRHGRYLRLNFTHPSSEQIELGLETIASQLFD
ncbi:PLP-dependent aminotransferase family protein [Pelagicoccus sp. SDUM812003]|uniref:aminotransferase-like domain-containing protein n=1 Tax=Pelagicoccus sp. SDUM812003 TaxID=3041267 RepID=UPI002810547C|nr:PLP-dependent aminotransferase family protein [Pelagicoccus sp. SDUM812003]MDQ8202847.1 PLP-dependent aminotransferase family protein [Pelagicoccus sp. SDUM812003]